MTDCIQEDGRCLDVAILRVIVDQGGTAQQEDYDILKQAALKKTGCKTESCLLQYAKDKHLLKRKQITDELKKMLPFGPKLNKELITNFNIDDFCSLLEAKHEWFSHIGTMMIDHYFISGKLTGHVQPKDIVNFIKRNPDRKIFGMVINTDVYTGDGEHWFAAMITAQDNEPAKTEIFDSQREPNEIEKSIIKFFEDVITQLGSGTQVLLVSHGHHQQLDTECGVYSLYFIQHRASGKSSDVFKTTTIKDNEMYKFRKKMFREHQIY